MLDTSQLRTDPCTIGNRGRKHSHCSNSYFKILKWNYKGKATNPAVTHQTWHMIAQRPRKPRQPKLAEQIKREKKNTRTRNSVQGTTGILTHRKGQSWSCEDHKHSQRLERTVEPELSGDTIGLVPVSAFQTWISQSWLSTGHDTHGRTASGARG